MRILTLARDLRRRKAREKNGLFAVEGVRAVEELVRSPLRIIGALVSPQLSSNARGESLKSLLAAHAVEIAEVTAAELASAADTETPQGIVVIAAVPTRSLADFAPAEPMRILVLDGVQDPGNVGTMVRTAAGLGATATVALPGTVDLWNAKVVRSAMGAHFLHPALHSTWDELRLFLRETDTPLWGAEVDGEPLARTRPPNRLALAVGNEGAGLTADVRAACAQVVSLPLARGVESLNVAVAAGILLYELRA